MFVIILTVPRHLRAQRTSVVTARPSENEREREKRIAFSAQENPPNNDWEDNSKKLAGYLTFTGSLEAVRRFVNGQEGSQESRDVHVWIEKVSRRLLV